MKRLAVALSFWLGCSGPSIPPSASPSVAPGERAAPAAPTTACYAGVSSAGDHKVRTIARRTVDPAARQIVEDVSHGETGSYGTRRFHVVMNVDGDHFTMKEAGGAFTGTGTLVGEPWQWTSWTSISQVPEAGVEAGLEIESRDELTSTGIQATKQIRKDGKVVTTAIEQLTAFDCAEWDAAEAELAAPVLDQALCDHACRNYATVMYWSTADAEIARLPPESRDEARKQKAADLGSKLEAGVPACVTQCLESHNLAQVACMDRATSAPALRACIAQ